jgi:hypothetical protein
MLVYVMGGPARDFKAIHLVRKSLYGTGQNVLG